MTLFSVSLGSCKPSENSVLRSAKRAPANVRRLNNISDVIFYCLVGERSRALALLNAALDFTEAHRCKQHNKNGVIDHLFVGRILTDFVDIEEFFFSYDFTNFVIHPYI